MPSFASESLSYQRGNGRERELREANQPLTFFAACGGVAESMSQALSLCEEGLVINGDKSPALRKQLLDAIKALSRVQNTAMVYRGSHQPRKGGPPGSQLK